MDFRFVDDLEDSYNTALLIIVSINIGALALATIAVVLKTNEFSEGVRVIMANGGGFMHLFWSSWLGHNLIVQSEKVFPSTYQNQWYVMSPRDQKMLVPFMMQSEKPCQITAGKFYIMSMESFGGALRMIASLYTFLTSVR